MSRCISQYLVTSTMKLNVLIIEVFVSGQKISPQIWSRDATTRWRQSGKTASAYEEQLL